jgi:hypothetical protein
VDEDDGGLRLEGGFKRGGYLLGPAGGVCISQLNDAAGRLGFAFIGSFALEGLDDEGGGGFANGLRRGVDEGDAAADALVEADDGDASLDGLGDGDFEDGIRNWIEENGEGLAGDGLAELLCLGGCLACGIERGDEKAVFTASEDAEEIILVGGKGGGPPVDCSKSTSRRPSVGTRPKVRAISSGGRKAMPPAWSIFCNCLLCWAKGSLACSSGRATGSERWPSRRRKWGLSKAGNAWLVGE